MLPMCARERCPAWLTAASKALALTPCFLPTIPRTPFQSPSLFQGSRHRGRAPFLRRHHRSEAARHRKGETLQAPSAGHKQPAESRAPASASQCSCPHRKELYHPGGWLSSDLCPSCAAGSDSRGGRPAGAEAKSSGGGGGRGPDGRRREGAARAELRR